MTHYPFLMKKVLYSIEDIKEFENLNEIVLLQNQVQETLLQDELGKESFHEIIRKVFEPVTDTIKNNSENITSTKTETSINNNKALENLNNKHL